MGKSIGIDLGTTNSVVAFKDATVRVIATGANNEDLCRSCVALDKSGSFNVGNVPFNNWGKYAPNIVVSVKRLMGAAISDSNVQKMKEDKDLYPYGIGKMSGGTEESVVVIMNGKEFSPEQISAEILRRLKEDAAVKLGGEITHAVITVPAYFNEKQRTATRKAAELAGLKVQRLLSEPTAAAISYGADKMAADEDKNFLVYDFGGGTFDLSILVASGGNFIESGTGGDRWLGGDDIDRLISEYVLSEVNKANNNIDIHRIIEALPDKKRYGFQGAFKKEIESVKKALSQSESATIAIYDRLEDEDGEPLDIEVTLTRDKFEDMIRPLVQRTLDLIDELLEKTAFPIDAIDNILLVGGSSCIPLVRKMLCDKYGKDKILSSEKPMLAIAEGAAILSHSMGTESECPHCGKLVPLGTDECPHCHNSFNASSQVAPEDGGVIVSISTKHKTYIEVTDDADNKDYDLIIDSTIPLPCEVNKKFYTVVENQKIVSVKLFTDKENQSKEQTGIGFFTISENLPVHTELQFSFRLTEDETMKIKVRVPATGKTTNVVLSRGKLDEHCLLSIGPSFDQIMNDSNISDSKKIEFMEKVQKAIDLISTSNLEPEDNKWKDIENSIISARTIAITKEDEGSIQPILAKILLDNFGRFISENDKATLRAELSRALNSSSPIEKNDAEQKLEAITDKYSLFTVGFLLNIAGHDSSDPIKANKALVAFNQFMAALNQGNYQRAHEILSANENLIETTKIPTGTGTGIGRG